MKKMIIAASVMAIAAVSQAASWQWYQSNDGYGVPGTGASEEYISGSYTAYLFDALVVSQDTLVKSFDGSTFTGTYISGANSTASEDGIAAQTFDYTPSGDSLTSYYAFIYGDKLFVSESETKMVQATSTATIGFADPWEASAADAMAASEGFKGMGWYAASSGPAPIPEPTSGLLMLLGVAGLALRRRSRV